MQNTSTRYRRLRRFNAIRLVHVSARENAKEMFHVVLCRAKRGCPQRDRHATSARLPTISHQTITQGPFTNLPFMEATRASTRYLPSSRCVPFNGTRGNTQSYLIVTLNDRIRFRFSVREGIMGNISLRIRHVTATNNVFKSVLRFQVARGTRAKRTNLNLFLLLLQVRVTKTRFRPIMRRLQASARLPFMGSNRVFVPSKVYQ